MGCVVFCGVDAGGSLLKMEVQDDAMMVLGALMEKSRAHTGTLLIFALHGCRYESCGGVDCLKGWSDVLFITVLSVVGKGCVCVCCISMAIVFVPSIRELATTLQRGGSGKMWHCLSISVEASTRVV